MALHMLNMVYLFLNIEKDGKDHLWIKFYDGNQTNADPYLVSTFQNDSDRAYTVNRVGNGIPYVIITARAPERTRW